MSVPVAIDAHLDAARACLRQGLLREAERELAAVPADVPLVERGSVALLEGNIAYERGDYGRAAEAWAAALDHFQGDESLAGYAAAAAGNLELTRGRVERAEELGRAEGRLELQFALVLGVALAALVLAAWWSRPRAASSTASS